MVIEFFQNSNSFVKLSLRSTNIDQLVSNTRMIVRLGGKFWKLYQQSKMFQVHYGATYHFWTNMIKSYGPFIMIEKCMKQTPSRFWHLKTNGLVRYINAIFNLGRINFLIFSINKHWHSILRLRDLSRLKSSLFKRLLCLQTRLVDPRTKWFILNNLKSLKIVLCLPQ